MVRDDFCEAKIPHHDKALAPHHDKALAPHHDKALAPHHDKALAPHHDKALAPHHDKALAPHHDKALAPHHDKAIAPHHDNACWRLSIYGCDFFDSGNTSGSLVSTETFMRSRAMRSMASYSLIIVTPAPPDTNRNPTRSGTISSGHNVRVRSASFPMVRSFGCAEEGGCGVRFSHV